MDHERRQFSEEIGEIDLRLGRGQDRYRILLDGWQEVGGQYEPSERPVPLRRRGESRLVSGRLRASPPTSTASGSGSRAGSAIPGSSGSRGSTTTSSAMSAILLPFASISRTIRCSGRWNGSTRMVPSRRRHAEPARSWAAYLGPGQNAG